MVMELFYMEEELVSCRIIVYSKSSHFHPLALVVQQP
jgi:hypothetical protein